jgi:PAS domain-containing protein
MFLWALFKTNLLSAIALILALATLAMCLRLLRRQRTSTDRYLMGLVGLIAIYQGLNILRNAGVYSLAHQLQGVSGAVDLALAGMTLVSILILRMAARDRLNTKLQLRVAEATRTPPRPAGGRLGERSAVAVLGVNADGRINLWHRSSEDFFGWRKEEVLGTRLPFETDAEAGGPEVPPCSPRKLRLATRFGEILDSHVWLTPAPDGTGNLVVVLDFERVRAQPPAKSPQPIGFSRAELTTAV